MAAGHARPREAGFDAHMVKPAKEKIGELLNSMRKQAVS
jgi:hypothetical protein